MPCIRRFFAIVLLLAFLMPDGRGVAFAPPTPGPQPVVVLDDSGLVLEWQTPDAQIETLGGGKARVIIPGFQTLSRPGSPQVPLSSVLVALPPGAEPVLTIDRLEEQVIALPGSLELAPQPEGLERDSDGTILGGAYAPSTTPVPFQSEPVVLERLGVLRGIELGRVVFYPARPDGGQLHLTTSIRAVLTFLGTGSNASQREFNPDALQALVESAVINPQHLEANAVEPSSRQVAATSFSGGPGVAIEVTQRGLVAVDYNALAAAGFPVSEVAPELLHLTRSGVEVAFEWEGDGDSRFEAGERIIFYAQPRFSRWTAADVYLLYAGEDPGVRVTPRSAKPASLPAGDAWVEVVAEENMIYTPDCYCAPIPAGRDGDRWVWDRLQWTGPDTDRTFPLHLSGVDSERTAQLSLWFIGFTARTAPGNDHRVKVTLNGQLLGAVEWDGKTAYQADFSIDGKMLKEGENLLQLSKPGGTGSELDGFWFDAFSIRYAGGGRIVSQGFSWEGEASPHSYSLPLDSPGAWRLYEVTDPHQPRRLVDYTLNGQGEVRLGEDQGGMKYYFARESEISNPSLIRSLAAVNEPAGADYLLISHAEFMPALDPLIALRRSQGLEVAVQDVQAVYDAFGDGRPDPEAIRSYLQHAYQNWNPRPLYVLLVGDGTTDPKQYQNGTPPSWIPPYLAEVDPWAGETAADNRYVTLSGSDNLPEMLIGRLPVNSLAEAEIVIRKITEYETGWEPGRWKDTAVLVADDDDHGGDYDSQSESILAGLGGQPKDIRRVYYQPDRGLEEDTRAKVLDTWNSGAGFMMYSGHSSIHQWAAENFLHLNDVSQLENGKKLPVIIEMTCFTSSFHVPGFSTLDETLLRHPGGGAVAVWGPTGLGLSSGHVFLAEGFAQSVWREGGASLGEAALSGKINLGSRYSGDLDLIDTFTLLGDPAMHIQFNAGSGLVYLPLVNP